MKARIFKFSLGLFLAGISTLNVQAKPFDLRNPQVRQLIEKEAESGNGYFQAMLGMALFYGTEMPINQERGLLLIQRSVQQGHPIGQAVLCRIQSSGRLGDAEIANGEALCSKSFAAVYARSQTDILAQSHLGALYLGGVHVEENLSEAEKWLRMAARKGDVMSQNNLGFIYRKLDVHRSDAVKWLRWSAERGFNIAQYNLGELLYEHIDHEEGIKFLTLAANQGNTGAQVKLGLIYFQHAEIKNYTESLKWFRRAAERGLADAQYLTGLMYIEGLGTSKNTGEGTRWIRKAAEQGHQESLKYLGL